MPKSAISVLSHFSAWCGGCWIILISRFLQWSAVNPKKRIQDWNGSFPMIFCIFPLALIKGQKFHNIYQDWKSFSHFCSCIARVHCNWDDIACVFHKFFSVFLTSKLAVGFINKSLISSVIPAFIQGGHIPAKIKFPVFSLC